jgi:HTH-type transcriptional regulator/antitoxin HigA
MSTKTKTKLNFPDMPRDYAGLVGILAPRPIRDKADYDNTVEVTDAMAVHADHFTADQEDYFDVLCTLIEAYDAQHVHWKKVPPLRMLKSFLEEANLKGADLARILGVSRNLGPAILRGERRITADHACALAAHFKVSPELFLEAPNAKQKHTKR